MKEVYKVSYLGSASVWLKQISQKHYLDWGSDTSSVWNSCAHSSDITPWGGGGGGAISGKVFSKSWWTVKLAISCKLVTYFSLEITQFK